MVPFAKPREAGATHSRRARLSPREPPLYPCITSCTRIGDGEGEGWDLGEGYWGHKPLGRLALPGTEERGKGLRMSSSSDNGLRSSFKMCG